MNNLIKPISAEHVDFLRDESRKDGKADFISFPKAENEVIDIVKEVAANNGNITTQGALTGITASAVPNGGTIINLSRMNKISELHAGESHSYLTVEPGVLLDDIRATAKSHNLFFPPDPTETSASIGGMVSCNASGAISFHYGSTRKWINALRIVLADGTILDIKRGQFIATGRSFKLTKTNGDIIDGNLPNYTIPDVKNAAGYYVADNMDMIDLFIGMEGTLGVITEIEIKLIKKPVVIVGLTAFLPSEDAAIGFVSKMRSAQATDARTAAIEFFNNDALNLLRTARETHSAFSDLPAISPDYNSAVYLEFHGNDADIIDEQIISTSELIIELGGSEDDCWCATTAQELEKLKAFRHATPELVNLKIDERRKDHPDLTKLGTDMSVPDCKLEHAMRMYNNGLKANSLESVIFGHIGNNHVHVNIIPRNMQEYARGKELYLEWAKTVVKIGGSVSAEHGIGKIKTSFLELMYGKNAIEEMRMLKSQFDPSNILNRGNLFCYSP